MTSTGLYRPAIVAGALGVLLWRTPTTFTNPQFWAEDGVIFATARLEGLSSITTVIAGYLTTAQFLVAILASYIDPAFAPAIYNYSAVAMTLLVVWLVTSPRLDLPAKPLLAIAVVIVPMGYEELGTLCNVQWILPIGAFAILFMKASPSRTTFAGEAIYIAVMSVTGPFSVFLAPLFIWRGYFSDDAQRPRLLILAAIMGVGAITQLILMLRYPGHGLPAGSYDRSLWITLPFQQVATSFGHFVHHWTLGDYSLPLGIALLLAAAAASLRDPYQQQKLFMLCFAAAIEFAGMFKFRHALETQIDATRYFYVAAVFSLWFFCMLSHRWRYLLFLTVAVIQIGLLNEIKDTPRIKDDLGWNSQAALLSGDGTVSIPISPPGWSITLPARAEKIAETNVATP